MKTVVRLACNLAIQHVAQAILDTLDGRRPMIDEPLVDDGKFGLDKVYTGPFEDMFWLNGPRLMWGPTEMTTPVVSSEPLRSVGTPLSGMGRQK